MSRRSRGFTLLEIVVSFVVASMLLVVLSVVLNLSLRGYNHVSDRSDLASQDAFALRVVRSLLTQAVRPALPAFRIQPFLNQPPWLASPGWTSGVHFFADINRDGRHEWVWIWVDPSTGSNPSGEFAPAPPFLKVAAFQRYPPDPQAWADMGPGGVFYDAWVNDDPRTHLVLAGNLLDRLGGSSFGAPSTMPPGFALQFQAGDTRADLVLSSIIDRARSPARLSSGIPARMLRETVDLDNNSRTSTWDPNLTGDLTANMQQVRDSAFTMTGTLAARLVEVQQP